MSRKVDVLNSAYEQIRISGITVNPTSAHVKSALDMLEDIMSDLALHRNVNIGWNFEDEPDANSFTGVERGHLNSIKKFLAINMIPSFDKQVPMELTRLANAAISGLVSFVASRDVRQVQAPRSMPRGSGHSRFNRYFKFERPDDQAPILSVANRMIVDEINDYTESFKNYLQDETIASYLIESSQALTIVSDSSTDDAVLYRVDAGKNEVTHQSVIITITTSTGRIKINVIEFEVQTTQHEVA